LRPNLRSICYACVQAQRCGGLQLVILPGSKATIADLTALRRRDLHIDVAGNRRRGGIVLGLCAGYQMLGQIIDDPSGSRGEPARPKASACLTSRQ